MTKTDFRRPRLYVLVGVPGSGKSTWILNRGPWPKTTTIVSTDAYVERFARRMGKTYSEVFKEVMPLAVRLMERKVVRARQASRDIVWDQTSTTPATRRKKLRMLPDYHRIAVVLPIPEREELLRRLNSRPGKTIPMEVVDDMIKKYEQPLLSEGFDELWFVE